MDLLRDIEPHPEVTNLAEKEREETVAGAGNPAEPNGGAPGREAGPPRGRGHKVPVSIVDKRRVGKEAGAADVPEPDTKPYYVQQLEERARRAEEAYRQRAEELRDETQRSRERLLRDLEKRFQDKEKAVLLEVLELLDDLNRACALTASEPKVAEGLTLIASRAGQFLKNHGCMSVNPLGEPFDPNVMEAVAMQEGPAETVVGVLQPGYLRGGELLRAARVVVGQGSTPR